MYRKPLFIDGQDRPVPAMAASLPRASCLVIDYFLGGCPLHGGSLVATALYTNGTAISVFMSCDV